MVLFLGKKWPCLVLAAYLVVAIMGIFTFMEIEPLRSINSLEEEPISGGFLAPIDHFIDCLTEGVTITNKTGGYSFFSLRSGYMRILPLFGIKNPGGFLSGPSLRALENVQYLNMKNTILLKLRT
jgi:hypothetical protein